jgi:hypothetical protein
MLRMSMHMLPLMLRMLLRTLLLNVAVLTLPRMVPLNVAHAVLRTLLFNVFPDWIWAWISA